MCRTCLRTEDCLLTSENLQNFIVTSTHSSRPALNEVDWQPTLPCSRLGAAQPGRRWLTGSYLLIHPRARALGGAHVRVKVLLDLQPEGKPPPRTLLAPQQAAPPEPHALPRASGAATRDGEPDQDASPNLQQHPVDQHPRTSDTSSLQRFRSLERRAAAVAQWPAQEQHDWLHQAQETASAADAAGMQLSVRDMRLSGRGSGGAGTAAALDMWAGYGDRDPGCRDHSRPGSASCLDGFWGLGSDGEVLLEGAAPSPQHCAFGDAAELDDELALFRAQLSRRSARVSEYPGMLGGGQCCSSSWDADSAQQSSTTAPAAALKCPSVKALPLGAPGEAARGLQLGSFASYCDAWGLDAFSISRESRAENTTPGPENAEEGQACKSMPQAGPSSGRTKAGEAAPLEDLCSPGAASSNCFVFSSAAAHRRSGYSERSPAAAAPDAGRAQPAATAAPEQPLCSAVSAAGAGVPVEPIPACQQSSPEPSNAAAEQLPSAWHEAVIVHARAAAPSKAAAVEMHDSLIGAPADGSYQEAALTGILTGSGRSSEHQAEVVPDTPVSGAVDTVLPAAVDMLLQQSVAEQTADWVRSAGEIAVHASSSPGNDRHLDAEPAAAEGAAHEAGSPTEEPDLAEEPDLKCHESLDMPPCRAPRPPSTASTATSAADAASPPGDLRGFSPQGVEQRFLLMVQCSMHASLYDRAGCSVCSLWLVCRPDHDSGWPSRVLTVLDL